jgi:hypothetical protein
MYKTSCAAINVASLKFQTPLTKNQNCFFLFGGGGVPEPDSAHPLTLNKVLLDDAFEWDSFVCDIQRAPMLLNSAVSREKFARPWYS